ncbi:ras-related protein Rab-30-like [Lepeophtheirus salmonis]|uniref:ras-related protein Rab-30-like n=1 Tax=Lepeophtheirus salmonis TaxID=72036 RepID=UPI001AE52475|nr:ras-related protein RABC1-like [Lepeophtheirus salmonis]
MATVKFPEQKVILCGEYGVGKSSLFRRFTTDTFTDKKSTLGLDHFTKTYANERLQITLWDTGGMERIGSITSSYYKFSKAAILVYALDCPDTFHLLSQHLLDIVMNAENAMIFLCGNKFDLKSKIRVSDHDMAIFHQQCHNLVSGIYKISCRTGEGIEHMFEDIAVKVAEYNRSRMEIYALEKNIGIDISRSTLEETYDKSCPNCCNN